MLKPLTILSLLGFVSMAACNTISGAGQDIERGGQAIEETANEVQQSIY